MLTIAKLKATRASGHEPFTLPLKCVVAGSLPPTSYLKDGLEKKVQNIVLCDSTGYVKATSFDVSKTEELAVSTTVVLRGFIFKPQTIIITHKTNIFKSAPLHVDQSIIDEAANFIRPPTPPIMTIKMAKLSPVKSMQSVGGKITHDEAPREVTVKGSTVKVRTITLEDKEDKVKVSLWRDHSHENVKAGDYVNLTNVLVTSYQEEVQLASTSRTKVEISIPPEERLSVTLLGFQCTTSGYDLLCQLQGDEITTFTCPIDLLKQLVPSEDLDSDQESSSSGTESSLDERILKYIPGICGFQCRDRSITAITAPLEKLP